MIFLNLDWLHCFIELHSENFDSAKFKIGDDVLYNGNIHKILAVNMCDANLIEYAIDNHNFLVWEDELNPITKAE